MPVDNDTHLWRTCGPDVENALSPAYTGESARGCRLEVTTLGLVALTLVSEGHPRGNGDGPLTHPLEQTEQKG